MCAVSCFFILYFTRSQHFLLRQIHISVLFGYICMRFLESAFLTALDSYFCAVWLYLHAFYLAAASTSSALLDIPSLQSHIVIVENESIIQQQHYHSVVFSCPRQLNRSYLIFVIFFYTGKIFGE